ncbi:MAG: hypothetical protein HeimC2_14260, partial [Candidatus Heimdallarchaeota archaeon LC_2]
MVLILQAPMVFILMIPSQSDLYKKVKDPFTGQESYAIQAIIPDVAIIHVQGADMYGNCIHHG